MRSLRGGGGGGWRERSRGRCEPRDLLPTPGENDRYYFYYRNTHAFTRRIALEISTLDIGFSRYRKTRHVTLTHRYIYQNNI